MGLTKLSIIIVNWNSKDYLRQCLDSILANTENVQFEVLVYDNASYDGAGEMVKLNYPMVQYLQATVNHGFARANNEAFRHAIGEYLLFLNPDTEIVGPAIKNMLDNIKDLPGVGVAGCKLLNTNGSIQTSCIRAFPSILNQMLESDFLRKYFPKSRLWGTRPLFEGALKPIQVDAVSGACLMTLRSAFEGIGKFSQDYFMYSEDIDLCHKARRKGLKNYYIPNAVVIHHGGGSSSSTKTNSFSDVMALESRWRFFLKTRALWYCQIYRLTIILSCVIRIGLAAVLMIFTRSDKMSNVINKWTAKLKWSLGRQKWVKNH